MDGNFADFTIALCSGTFCENCNLCKYLVTHPTNSPTTGVIYYAEYEVLSPYNAVPTAHPFCIRYIVFGFTDESDYSIFVSSHHWTLDGILSAKIMGHSTVESRRDFVLITKSQGTAHTKTVCFVLNKLCEYELE